MNHADHVRLIRDGVPGGGIWAELGSGRGAFTLALADLLGPTGEIYSVDRDQGALRDQRQAMRAQFPAVQTHYVAADFTGPLQLPPLDGIIMANAFHFIDTRHKDAVIQLIKGYLRPGGRLVIVEYNVDQGNTWVPYPFSYPTWEVMARRGGFSDTRLLATIPTRFLNEMYSAISFS
jgi:ubiquinone/menaquinone biosynthesis C-methylase UbiE